MTQITPESYLERVKASPDARLARCGWCPPYKGERWCSQVIGFLPGCEARQAGFACDPCIARYQLSYLKDPNDNPMVLLQGKV